MNREHYESELAKELNEIANWAENHPQLSPAEKNFVDGAITRVRSLIEALTSKNIKWVDRDKSV